MKVLNEQQVRNLTRDERVVHQFVVRNRVLYMSGAEMDSDERRADIYATPGKTVVLVPSGRKLVRARVVGKNGYRIHLTSSGVEYAESIEATYSGIIDKDAYLAAHEKNRISQASIRARKIALQKDDSKENPEPQ